MMDYSPKLKKVMERIKLILKSENVGASVVLHAPGFSEFYLHVDPDYSCAKMENNGVRIRAKLADFKGNKTNRDLAITDTINLLVHLADTSGQTSLMLYHLLDEVKKHIDFDSDEGNLSSHTTQNN